MFQKLRAITSHTKRELKVYRFVVKDKRTPKLGKFFLGAAIGYFFLPFDLIPDFIPVIGHIDDLIIIPVLVFIALKFIPNEIIEEYRTQLDK